jgi:Domain of unknown function (DUF4440)
MQPGENDSMREWTEAIFARLIIQWEAWKNRDAASNDAVIADGFQAFCPDGIRRAGRPTAKQMAEQPISGYKLSEFRVVPVEANSALVTYFAEIHTPDGMVHHMAVGEVWAKRADQWLIRAFSGTLIKGK